MTIMGNGCGVVVVAVSIFQLWNDEGVKWWVKKLKLIWCMLSDDFAFLPFCLRTKEMRTWQFSWLRPTWSQSLASLTRTRYIYIYMSSLLTSISVPLYIYLSIYTHPCIWWYMQLWTLALILHDNNVYILGNWVAHTHTNIYRFEYLVYLLRT